jgi:hypothetical protein
MATAAAAEAQSASAGVTADRPAWDVNFTAGLFEGRPSPSEERYGDAWYYEGRYAIAAGHYWTENLETEVEFATTGEGRRYVNDYVVLPNGMIYPYGVEKLHRIQQGSARMVWQFLDNTWVHPYLSAGFVFEADRTRHRLPWGSYHPNDPRGGPPQLVNNLINSGEVTDYRGGVTAGGGTKIYVSQNAYLNAGILSTYAKPSTTVTFLVGFGFDF